MQLRVLILLSIASAASAQSLYHQFQDPPKSNTIRPYWSWVERIQPDEVRDQIHRMVDQKVYGAYVYGFDGLRTPWMSPEWMDGFRAALEEGKKLGFEVGFITDYVWPQGDYRDIWNLPPPQSHVLRKNPEWIRRRLAHEDREVDGPAAVEIIGLRKPMIAVAGKLGPDGAYLEETLQLVNSGIHGSVFRWNAPAGHWRVTVFCLEDHPMWHAYVDLMNRDAVAAYIQMVLAEHYRQFGPYFGKTITSAVSDHEGEYGYRIAWTPGLFETFEKTKSYRLEKYLPLLLYEGGRMTEKVRCDYLDVVSDLYSNNYWGQVSDWLKARGVTLTGHEWEEMVQAGAAFQGDFMKVQRHIAMPGIDSLYDWSDSPRHFKEAASVAHFLGRPFWCENQILQGQKSFISPQEMRLGTNTAAAWGASVFTPWFDYGKHIVDFPPVWDWRQPFWKYFHYYADYTRRLSFMNSQGHHVAGVLLYYPLVSVWAKSSPVFNEAQWDMGRSGPRRNPNDPDSPPVYDFYWHNTAEVTEQTYSALMDKLVDSQWDFDVTDDYFLSGARIEGGELVIGPERFHAIILPPMTAIRRSALEKILAFRRAGGLVISMGYLPTISMEDGRNDPKLRPLVNELRDTLVGREASEAIEVLEKYAAKDFRVVQGDAAKLYYSHRTDQGTDYYWVVNDTGDEREVTAELGASGGAEKWSAEDGSRSPLNCESSGRGTRVRLHLDPWEAYYVTVAPTIAYRRVPEPYVSTLAVLPVDGWKFRVDSQFIDAPYARMAVDHDGSALARGWQNQQFDDSFWRDQWLSPERFAITNWKFLGPFPARVHEGFNTPFGPELDGLRVDLAKVYSLPDGTARWWRDYYSGQAGDDTWTTDLGLLMSKSESGAIAYTVTYVDSPDDREVEAQLSADDAKVWVNGHAVMSFHDEPAYRENRVAFAHTAKVRLHKGRNEILLKLEREGHINFYFRLKGMDLPLASGSFWYRIAIPPGAAEAILPASNYAQIYVNGTRIAPNSEIPMPSLDWSQANVLVLNTRKELAGTIRFRPGEGPWRLGCWTNTGLANYSGAATYERSFDMPQGEHGRGRLYLDLGDVGVAAEVWLNGKKVGERAWKPFRYDITDAVRDGSNDLRIIVVNSGANARAVAGQRDLLKNIDLDGLEGPVRILRVL